MAWRPTAYLLEGELDNTSPGKVMGWMRFAGLKDKVTFDLEGNFHRDIRGAKIRFSGDGQEGTEAQRFMDGFSTHHTGHAGDMTAGLPPCDYTNYPYLEWFGEENGRVVIELDSDQVEVIGRPIPACESDPIDRKVQNRHMAKFMGGLSQALGAPAVVAGGDRPLISDPGFSHWVVEQGKTVGEAHSVEVASNGMSFAFVRLFNMPDEAEFGYIQTVQLQAKNGHV